MRLPTKPRRRRAVKPAAPTTSNEAAQIAYWKGRAFLDRRDLTGNPQAALKEFEDAVKADPKFAMGYAGLAEAQWAMWSNTNDKSWADKAIANTATAVTLEPDRPAVRYSAGLTLFRSGQFEEARQELEKAIALQPTSEEATRLLGRVLIRQGKIDQGLAAFHKALAIRPNSVAVHTEMGLALFSASRYPEALDAFEKAIALAPNSSSALSQAGAAALAMGDNATGVGVLRTGDRDPAASRNVLEHGDDLLRAGRVFEGGKRLRGGAADSAVTRDDASQPR